MRTKLMILLIFSAAVLVAAGATAGLVLWLGFLGGLLLAVAAGLLILLVYRVVIEPWQHRWGASDEEVLRAMAGDDLLPFATTTTRAIGIAAPPDAVWPWIVQIGYGRAGWYSYDWIDNDFRHSADRVIPELQHLDVGDRILMTPGEGPEVKEVVPNQYILSARDASDTWCLALYPENGGTRLVSRWRADWPLNAATLFWILLSDPGAFIMERRMLKGIKQRAEGSLAAV